MLDPREWGRRIPNYSRATNAAYAELAQYDGKFPVIDIYGIILASNDILLKSYEQAAQFLKCSHNVFTYNISQSEYGFTVIRRDKSIIFYNNKKDEKTIRFTLAHELGHIRLGHTEDNSKSDKEANCFARNLLCPIPLVKGYKLASAKDYEECFGISEPFAKAAFAHSSEDLHYISEGNYQAVDDKIYCYLNGCTMSELYGY